VKYIFKIFLVVISLASMLVAQNKPIKAFDLVDTNGKDIKVIPLDSGLQVVGAEGKVVIIEFFGHRCPPCLKTIPHLIAVKNKYKDKLEIIAVEVQGLNNDQLKVFAKSKGINYHTVSDEKAGIFTNYIAQAAKWQGSIPFMLVLDTKGQAQYIQTGLIPQYVLDKAIGELSQQASK